MEGYESDEYNESQEICYAKSDNTVEDQDPETETICSVCQAEFLDSEDLEVHMSQVHHINIKLMSCPFCLIPLSSMESYALHLRDAHLHTLKCCRYCMRAFLDSDLLRKHETKHYHLVKKSMYSCSQCSRLFNNILELEKHEYENHTSDGVFLHGCLSLLSSVLNIKAVKFLKSHDDTVYICIKCRYMTGDVSDYLCHLKETNCRSYACDQCYNVYESKLSLRKHIVNSKSCKNQREAPIAKQCTKCLQYFDAKIWKAHYGGCKPIKCNTCNIIFESTHELTNHQTKAHPKFATVKRCKYCYSDFVADGALEKHIERVHKPKMHLYKYFCSFCPERQIFPHPKLLFAHFFSKHRSLQPFHCMICDKKFKFRKKFTLHIKLDHKSNGYVEFDDKFQVIFTDKKPLRQFQPKSIDLQSNLKNTAKTSSVNTITMRNVSEDIETEVDYASTDAISEADTKPSKPKSSQRKLKQKFKNKNREKHQPDQSSDDEPLLVVKKRIKAITQNRNRFGRMTKVNDNSKRYLCKVCNKNCKNAESYRRHFYGHYSSGSKKCVRCNENFKTSKELTNHISSQHSTSKLTETLKTLLEKRKQTGNTNVTQKISSELFRNTVKKVPDDRSGFKANLTEIATNGSVQSFIENFIPDANDSVKKNLIINTSVTVKVITEPRSQKVPIIKMNKFTPDTDYLGIDAKLSMPIRFKPKVFDQPTVSVQLVNTPRARSSLDYNEDFLNEESFDNNDYDYKNHEDEEPNENYKHQVEEEKNETMIPDVAQEVMLEVTEETEKSGNDVKAKIVIPQLPQQFKNIRIAHLLPKAPFYKIVKVNDILETETKPSHPEPLGHIQLPSGTKLVSVNPLAHLLGNKSLQSVVKKNKYYKYQPKTKPANVQKALAKALTELEKGTRFSHKTKKAKNGTECNNCIIEE